MRSATFTPAGAIARGLLAGVIGTAAMDAFLYARYKGDGGQSRFSDWELSNGLTSWEEAPAPAHVGKRLFEGLFQTELPATRAPLVSNVMHWGYGIANAAQYGVVAGSLPEQRVRYGVPFGAAVWASSYVILPLAKLYEPIWKYDGKTLANDLSAHLVYGVTTAAAMRQLSRRKSLS
jgi:uncharacterized protein DUF1440